MIKKRFLFLFHSPYLKLILKNTILFATFKMEGSYGSALYD